MCWILQQRFRLLNLCPWIPDLCVYGDEELGSVLCMVSTMPRLKYLELNTSPRLTAISSLPAITISNLETLVMHGSWFQKEHLQKGDEYAAWLVYSINLSPQCNWPCINCRPK
jgi:hypothetical protein